MLPSKARHLSLAMCVFLLCLATDARGQPLQGQFILPLREVPDPTVALGPQYHLKVGEKFKFIPAPSSAARRKFCVDSGLMIGKSEADNLTFAWSDKKLILVGVTYAAHGKELRSVLASIAHGIARFQRNDFPTRYLR